jgi:hypothetical protein
MTIQIKMYLVLQHELFISHVGITFQSQVQHVNSTTFHFIKCPILLLHLIGFHN